MLIAQFLIVFITAADACHLEVKQVSSTEYLFSLVDGLRRSHGVKCMNVVLNIKCEGVIQNIQTLWGVGNLIYKTL